MTEQRHERLLLTRDEIHMLLQLVWATRNESEAMKGLREYLEKRFEKAEKGVGRDTG